MIYFSSQQNDKWKAQKRLIRTYLDIYFTKQFKQCVQILNIFLQNSEKYYYIINVCSRKLII
jgi:hypothetical protein